jgi:hypothetical protein
MIKLDYFSSGFVTFKFAVFHGTETHNPRKNTQKNILEKSTQHFSFEWGICYFL